MDVTFVSVFPFTQEFYDRVHLHAHRSCHFCAEAEVLGPLEDIFLTTFVDLSVDYIVHVTHAYSQTLAGTLRQKWESTYARGQCCESNEPSCKVLSQVTRPVV